MLLLNAIGLLCICTATAFAQHSGHKTYFKINPTTLVNELDLYMEQEMGTSTSLEIGMGGIYTDYWDHLLNQVDFGQIKPNLSERQYLNAKGVAGRIGLRYYVISNYSDEKRSRGTYFEPMLLFKQLWYPSDTKTIDDNDYPEKGSKRVWGLQLLIGRQHEKGKWLIDKYVGLGIKAKTFSFDNYRTSGTPIAVKNDANTTTSWLPSVHLGIKIGLVSGKH